MTDLEKKILEGTSSRQLVAQGFRSTAVKYARKRLKKTGRYNIVENRFIEKKGGV